MPSHDNRKCSGKKSCQPTESQTCSERILSRLLINQSSRQVIRVPSNSRTPMPNESPSKTNLQNDVQYCTSDTCRNSLSCIKNLPKYCPYGIKNDNDTSVCPGTCSQLDDGNELDAVDYRHSMISVAESITKSLHYLTGGCPAATKSSLAPRGSLSRAAPYPADENRDVQEEYCSAGSRVAMQLPSPEFSDHESDNEQLSRKAYCCPDVASDTDDAIDQTPSQEQICPSVKAYLEKQTSTQDFNRPRLSTKEKSLSRSAPTEPALSRTATSKGAKKSTKSIQAITAEESTSPKQTCPASALKLISEIPCSALSGQVNDKALDSRRSAPVPERKSSCCTNNQQSPLKIAPTGERSQDMEPQSYQNAERSSLVTRKNQLSQEAGKAKCCLPEELKKVDTMRPCTGENFPCCNSSTNKSAIALVQEKVAKPASSCGKPSCNMTICGPKPEYNAKSISIGELPKSSTKLNSANSENTAKQKNIEVTSNNCTSALCLGNEAKSQCNCRYPPAFRQFGCTGNIAGNCDCANNKNQ